MASWEFALFLGLAGMAVGSFLNLCIDRLPRGESILAKPSHCEGCGHTLSPRDLVPVVSYLWLRGRCRYCGARILRRLPLVEAATGALFAAAAVRFGVAVATLPTLAFLSVLVVVFVVDLERKLILNKVLYPTAAVALAVAPWGTVGAGNGLLGSYALAALGALVGGGVLFLVYLGARGGFGAGDVGLGGTLGLVLGLAGVVVALELAFVVGGIVALLLLLLRVKRRRDLIPFGPFLAGAGMVSLFWGQEIFDWYKAILGFL